ncbi:alpha/beta hydrolase family protein [Vibrio penaeicida]|uniref:alpha/beta hydrolase family protein n=1 Tax=Vibrio penaeicida TaxID=104609 RepID=UPI000CE9F144|nr:alpha/beta hydrolase [Vibrio penaeicida]
MIKPYSLFLLACLLFPSLSNSEDIGFLQTSIESDTRPFNLTIWYPTRDNTALKVKVADNIAFEGISVRKNAQIHHEKRPLVMLSHGYRGSWRNLNWLAEYLVDSGYIVAAPDHPGTTTFNPSQEQAAMWWERPRDISRAIDWMLTDSEFHSVVDRKNIAAIGHSMGGWTVINLAGGKTDSTQIKQECLAHPNPQVCKLLPEMGLDKPTKQHSHLIDERIKAVVSLDLGLARGFTPDSLQQVDIPVLIQAAGTNTAYLPHELESGYLASILPAKTTRYELIQDATHFSFMQLCKPGGRAIIEEEHKGDGMVCDDGMKRTRQELHAAMAESIKGFLEVSLTH